jgi:deferrochelatase/peroxidase EfeB
MTREITRRQLLAGSGLATAGIVGAGLTGAALGAPDAGADPAGGSSSRIPFFGDHQAGIATPEQARMVFAAYDVTASDAAGLSALLAQWSATAARLTAGEAVDGPTRPFAPPADTGEALGLPASNLTITVGFGPTLFDGRFGLGPRRPAALVDLPAFAGDALDDSLTGGDLCIQACADDPQVAFHAVHNLTRLALGSATVRYLQLGFGRTASAGPGKGTPRNLLGFHDGINNLDPADAEAMRHSVWVDSGADQPWMAGGTYLVARRIHIHLEAWDTTTLDAQEQTIGRKKVSGAPLGPIGEPYSGNLEALGPDGQPVIPNDAHIRVAAPVTNDGQAILRRGYSFADGIDPASGELDAGLYFICFQKDPRLQFIPIQTRLSDIDALAQFLLPTGGGIFACPPGITADQAWGRGLV